MKYPSIEKSSGYPGIPPHLDDYEKVCKQFSWETARAALHGLPEDRGLNIAYEAVDYHASGANGSRTAIRWLGADGTRMDISYRKLQQQSNRFANVLQSLDVKKGDTVFTLLGRIPLLYAVVIGTLKHVSVICPLFEAFVSVHQHPICARSGCRA